MRPAAATVLALALGLGVPGASAGADRRADTTPPVVDAVTWSPMTPYVYGTAVLTATAHDDSGVVELSWVFGDGGVATGATVSHTFTQAGSVQVTVTAADAAGNTASTTTYVPVSAFQPEPPGTYDPPVLRRVRLRPSTLSSRGGTAGVARRVRLSFRVARLRDETDVVVTVRGRGGLPTARRALRDVREGRHVVRLGARIGGVLLAPGRYQVVVRAENRYGSDRSLTRLRVVR
ncbi:PKD domain-containing protein [Nocardioides zeicaulis]|uniref:PKD domain-containing protein n=1 Tax=Nocardioides zeicaulis TaxID=1776857 RepID=A0ABV6E3V4_9ACTN